jgi:NADH-quinone oxidoreductase subunit E
MAAINDYYHEDLTPVSLASIIDRIAAGVPPAPGSATGRQGAAPEGEALTLTDGSLYDGSRARPMSLPNLPTPVSAPAE